MKSLIDFDETPAPAVDVMQEAERLASSGLPFNANTLRNAVPKAKGRVIAWALMRLMRKGHLNRLTSMPDEVSTCENARGRTVPWLVGAHG